MTQGVGLRCFILRSAIARRENFIRAKRLKTELRDRADWWGLKDASANI